MASLAAQESAAAKWRDEFLSSLDDLHEHFSRNQELHPLMGQGIMYHCPPDDCNYVKHKFLRSPCNCIGIIVGAIEPGTIVGDDPSPQPNWLFDVRYVDGNPCHQINASDVELDDFERKRGQDKARVTKIALSRVMISDMQNEYRFGRSIAQNKANGFGIAFTNGNDDQDDDEDSDKDVADSNNNGHASSGE